MNQQITRRTFITLSLAAAAAISLQGCQLFLSQADRAQLAQDRKEERQLLEKYLQDKYGFSRENYVVVGNEPLYDYGTTTHITLSYTGRWCYEISKDGQYFYVINNVSQKYDGELSGEDSLQVNALLQELHKRISALAALDSFEKKASISHEYQWMFGQYPIMISGLFDEENPFIPAKGENWFCQFSLRCTEADFNLKEQLRPLFAQSFPFSSIGSCNIEIETLSLKANPQNEFDYLQSYKWETNYYDEDYNKRIQGIKETYTSRNER